MNVRRSFLLLLPCTLALLALYLGWAVLDSGQSTSAAQPMTFSAVSADKPQPDRSSDPRWVGLVRAWESEFQADINGLQPESPDAALTINLNLTNGDLAGSAPTPLPVYASVTRGGVEVASGTAIPAPDPGMYFYSISLYWTELYPCPPDWCYPNGLEPGDQVWVTQGGTTISMTVPLLTVLAEPPTNILHGEAPANSNLTALVIPIADPTTYYTLTGSADPGGSYQLSLAPAHDLHRQDSGYLLVEPLPGRRAHRSFIAPLLRAQVGGSAISGVAPPNVTVYITRTDLTGGNQILLGGFSDSMGEFSLDYQTWGYQGAPTPLTPGDRLIAVAQGQVFSMTLPVLSVTSAIAGQQVNGQAAPGASLEVRRYPGPLYETYEDIIWKGTPVETASVTASPAGAYTAMLDVQAGDYIGVFQSLPDENQAYARTATPSIFARMNTTEEYYYYPLMQGQLGHPLAPITVTIQGPSSYYKDWRVLSSGNDGSFYYNSDYNSQHLAIDSGDVVRATSPYGEEIAFTLPVLTAEADQLSATVSGTAPPGARLTVVVNSAYPIFAAAASYDLDGLLDGFYPPEIPITQVVTASLIGSYLADFSQGWTFYDQYTYGEVILSDPQGNRASRTWNLGLCPPRLTGAQVGGNRVIADVGWHCTDASVHLSDHLGNPKAEAMLYQGQPFWQGGWQVDLYDITTGNPVPILPGDRLEIEYEGERTQSIVPRLYVQIDPASSLASGQAPAGERVSIELWRADENFPVPWLEPLAIVTATQSGAYQADMSGDYTYQTGDRIIVKLAEREQAYYALTVLPALDVQLYSNYVPGWLPPLNPFTLRYSGTFTSAEQSASATTEGSFSVYLPAAGYQPTQIVPGDLLELETAGGTYLLTIPTLTANLDRQTARLSGKAPPGSRIRANIRDEDNTSSQGVTQVITASAQGTYSQDFPQLLPLGRTYGSLTYLHPDWHQVSLEFSTPHLELTLEYPCVEVHLPVSGAPASITMTSADGSFTETINLESISDWGNQQKACFSRSVGSGDLLKFLDAHGNQLSLRVPVFEARHDFADQALIGMAPPGAKVKAVFRFDYQEISRTPWIEADGSFGIDTSDLNLDIGIQGYVVMQDAEGNLVSRFFDITGYTVHLPIIGRAQ